MSETVRFERRFQGFADGALGGYAAGIVASRISGPAEANLRSLPLMERELELREPMTVRWGFGTETPWCSRRTPANSTSTSPSRRGLRRPRRPSRDPVHDHGPHLYPECFTCGPDRAAGDGLRVFMGQAPERPGILAAAWTPDPGLVQAPTLPEEFIWAALDCPTIWAAWLTDDGAVKWPEGGRFTVLARQRVEQHGPVPTGEPAIVTAWPISRDGRKHVTGAAIQTPDGELLARGESLLIDVQR